MKHSVYTVRIYNSLGPQEIDRKNPVDPPVVKQLPTLPQIPLLDETPSFSEVHRAVSCLKSNKAADPDGLSGEIFKYGGHHIIHRLHKFISDTWQAEMLPQQWKDANRRGHLQ